MVGSSVRNLALGIVAVGLVSAGCSCDEPGRVRGLGPSFEIRAYEDGTAPAEGATLADDARLDFGVVKIRQTATKNVALRNGGSAPMHVDDPVLEKGVEFKLANVLVPCNDRGGDKNEVPVGECSTLQITYTPSDLGDHTDTLTLVSDDSNRGTVHITLVGRGATGQLEVCVASQPGPDKLFPLDQCSTLDDKDLDLALGAVPLNAGDVKRRIRVTNVGELPLDIDSIRPAPSDPIDFAIDPSDFKAQLAKGESVEVALVFQPSDIGERTGTITVSADDPRSAPVLIHVVSQGDAAKLCIDPATLDFGDVGLGTTSTKAIKLTNCGTKPLQLTNLALEGDQTFSINTPPSAQPLAPNTSTQVMIDFKPTTLGPKSGRARIVSTDQVSPISFANLRGNGFAPPECHLEASTTTVDFGAVVAGNTMVKTVTFHNAGGIECELTNYSVDAAGTAVQFMVSSSPVKNYKLPANGLVDIKLGYKPQDANGPDVGTFTLAVPADTKNGGKVDVALKGTPTARPECRLDITPALSGTSRTLKFGAVGTGDKKTLTLTMKNVGGIDCQLGSPAFYALTDQNVFKFGAANPVLPGKIAPGGTSTLEVTFQPNKESTWYTYSNYFTLVTNDNQPSECGNSTLGCKKVALEGTGVKMAIDVVPGSVDFGVVTVGCNSAEKAVTIYNIGGAAVTISDIYVDPTTAPFTVTQKPALPYTLNAGSNITVKVKYRPSSPTTDTALLTIAHNFSNGLNTVPLKGSGTTDAHQIDLFTQNSQPKTDVLWVVDNSCSMSDKQQFMSSNAQQFITSANATNGDYQIAVISTDWSRTSPSTADSTTAYQGYKIYMGEFFPTPQAGKPTPATPQVIKRSDPNPSYELGQNIKVGNCCSDVAEAGLEAAKLALSNPLISDPTKPNSTFVRPDAKLAVIMLSDEQDQSPTTSVQYYVDFFQNLKGAKNSQLFAWHSIVGDAPSGCSKTTGSTYISADAGTRYLEASRLSAGITRSICTTDWGRIANDIGLDAFAAKTQFFLSRTCDSATLVVTVNGATKVKGTDYDFDAASNSVIFRSTAVPPAGANIKAEYNTLCL